jgi:hypothetical protein
MVGYDSVGPLARGEAGARLTPSLAAFAYAEGRPTYGWVAGAGMRWQW